MNKDERRAMLHKAAQEIAGHLRGNKDCHQEAAALKAGLHPRSYWRYLDHEGEEYQEFQTIVLAAVHDQAAANYEEAERAIGSTESGSGPWMNWHRWSLEKRYRKIYGDLEPKRVEVTGKDGRDLIPQMSDAEIEAKLAAIAAGVSAKREESDDDA